MIANLGLMYLKADLKIGFKDRFFVLSERRLIQLKILFGCFFHISLTAHPH